MVRVCVFMYGQRQIHTGYSTTEYSVNLVKKSSMFRQKFNDSELTHLAIYNPHNRRITGHTPETTTDIIVGSQDTPRKPVVTLNTIKWSRRSYYVAHI